MARHQSSHCNHGELGLEARAQAEDHLDTRLWLRLLACSTDIEQAVRQELRLNFQTTLSRFDYLAQLERHRDGLRMSELSQCLMVTGGNVTGLTDQLVQEGLVERTEDPADRRVWRVRLTAQGRRRFAQMAAAHEGWLRDWFVGMPATDKRMLFQLLGQLRQYLRDRSADEPVGTDPNTMPKPKTKPTPLATARAPAKPRLKAYT
jgi:DNA-binding MarR family transcriptional regulator